MRHLNLLHTAVAFLLVFIGAVQPLFAQQISGYVRDSVDRPITFASVYLADTHTGTVTDSKGYYNLTDLSKGKHEIIVGYLGMKTIHETVDVQASETRNFCMRENVIQLDEIVVTPNGQPMQYYLLGKLLAAYKPIKNRVSSYTGYTTSRFDVNTPLHLFPTRLQRTIRFLASIGGYGKIVQCIIDHPELALEMQANVTFDKGKLKAGKQTVRSNPSNLSQSELESFVKKDWGCGENPYDETYAKVRSMEKKLQSIVKKDPSKKLEMLKYKGSYTENGRTVYIIATKYYTMHIVDGLWQLKRFSDRDGSVDFLEVAKNEYLPICQRQTFRMDVSGDMQALQHKVDSVKALDTSSLSQKQLRKRNQEIRLAEGLIKNPSVKLKWSSTYNYKSVK